MKNVLVLIHDDDGQEARLQAALDLTRHLGGHLTCLDIERVPVATSELAGVMTVAPLILDEHEGSVKNRARTQARLAAEDVPWSWEHRNGDIIYDVSRRIDLSDIMVLNLDVHGPTVPEMRAAVSEAAMHARRPILAVPPALRSFDPGGIAMVAWDGSVPAINALRAATPLLAGASKVVIVEVDRRDDHGLAAEEAAAYLSRHGVETIIWSRTTNGMVRVATRLAETAKEMHADYIVMGAFGHARLTEAIFGGVTRSMLDHSPVPLLIAH